MEFNNKLIVGAIVALVVLCIAYYYTSTQPKPSPPIVKQWSMMSGKDLSGPALYALGRGSTVDQCKKGCMDTPGCVGFSTYPTSGECWGKASTTLTDHPDTAVYLYQ